MHEVGRQGRRDALVRDAAGYAGVLPRDLERMGARARRDEDLAHVRRAQLDTEGAQPFLARRPAWLGWSLAAASLSLLLVIGAWPWLGQWRELLP